MSEIKAIETEYNGYRFRSRAEARWAVLFDNAQIEYQYEAEGFEFPDGTKYLPDFYLPESRTFFEVKGIMKDLDKHKIDMLLKETKKPIVIGYANMCFEATDAWNDGTYTFAGRGESLLARCNRCGKLYFMGEEGSWYCRCCGAYDGDSHFSIVMRGNGDCNKDWEPLAKSRGARFEYGEKPFDESWQHPLMLMKLFGSQNSTITDYGLEINVKR